ncbi:hypothetical protein BCR33DRAFT_783493 [Rhizoclosmatium globosum]|uniref:PhoD-like phosphatase metallophosphatase domain-containing protein n=1 Tax=Rhizoclosmatium globosum TaxID=329046 RepID=A0A1Y2CGX9_9FUNG|nr:hypothetical protein BCR33DRAFT_783493 [Rhizoclosmatium globosum]|eukprot:ORY46313.1 hypothetical protein BCR33DRAFT_783493 [Rhizoclosmatium globosum]
MGRITGGEAILFFDVKPVFWFTDSRRSHPVFHHDHPKRTLFIIAVFLITSARFSLVVPRSKLFAHDKIATRISIETAESHASESQFYSQWTTGRLKFNKNVRDLRQPTGHPPFSSTEPRFLHGVASGDALSDRVIIWTKVSPPPETASFYVRYDISLSATEPDSSLPGSPFLNSTPQSVLFSAPSNIADHKYGKPHSLVFSPVGQTKTLPTKDDPTISSVQFAVVSCSNWPRGFFNVYSSIAARDEVDVVLHLGDYIYEYRNGEYGDGSSIGRIPKPDRELLTLGDYRERHAQYKEDEDLQSLHRLKPWIVIWDDHEFVDDISGFFNSAHSNETLIRIPAAMRAYFEYLPIRVQKNFHYKPAHLSLQSQNRDLAIEADQHNGIYRNFHFGKLLDLMMLDTRIHGRDRSDWATVLNEDRTILGDDQEQWLVQQLQESSDRGAAWRVIGNQVVFAQMDWWGLMFNSDAWDGYPASRKRILEAIEKRGIKDVVVLTGE